MSTPVAAGNSTTIVRELAPLLYVDDIRTSVEFYERLLAFHRTQQWEPNGELGWCRLERDGAALMLQQKCSEDRFADPRGDGVVFYFVCDDAVEVYHRLIEHGIAVDPPEVAFYGMQQVFIVDPDGYRLCFHSPCAAA